MSARVLVAHGGGPTPVINASLAGVLSAAYGDSRVERVYGARKGIEGVLKGDLLDLSGLSENELECLSRTPGSAIGSCRHKIREGDEHQLLEVFDSYGIDVFLYTGGNDSMDTCMRVARLSDKVQVIGIPKTIDNDLAETDHCPGFGSAARFFALSALEVALDVEALDIHVSVVEVLGRNAGWLTAACDLAHSVGDVGPEMILVPEMSFDQEAFLESIRDRWNRRRGFVVAVSEGLKGGDGQPLVSDQGKTGVDAFGHPLPGNVSHHLAQLIQQKLGIRTRSEKPGLVGRASRALTSEVDRDEAWKVGAYGLRSALDGATGHMVSLRRESSRPYRSVPQLVELERVANVERLLPSEFYDPESFRTTEAYTEFALPLLGSGLPDYFSVGRFLNGKGG